MKLFNAARERTFYFIFNAQFMSGCFQADNVHCDQLLAKKIHRFVGVYS